MSSSTIEGRVIDAWPSVVGDLGVGKVVGGSVYAHVSALPERTEAVIECAVAMGDVPDGAFNVVRFGLRHADVSLLSYPGFFVDAFPLLAESWSIDLEAGTTERRAYAPDANPPVLHRKELLLLHDDPLRALFAAVTAEAERRGLLEDASIIGHRVQWQEELRARGLRVTGHTLVERDAASDGEPPIIARHKTALVRRSLSMPMQALWRHGFLDGHRTVFDYGCGRGDDVAALRARAVEASGWDPYFRPDAPRIEADVVNLGFVLNVIEDPNERGHALASAFTLARHVLAVAALIGGRTALESQRLYRDGIFTRAGTFQKYFTHPELGAYVAGALGREPISVGPGLYFVFRTDEAEQCFLEGRQRSRVIEPAPAPPRTTSPRPTVPRERSQPERSKGTRRISKWDQHADLLEELWAAALSLGRAPANDAEFPRIRELKGIASTERAVARLAAIHGAEVLEGARSRRRRDLAVFLALDLFERRSFGALTPRVQRDVREFWGSYRLALELARALLFSVSDTAALERAAHDAATSELGHYVPGDAFSFDSALTNELPEILRVYVGCAGRLHGEVAQADLVKVHLASGKLTVTTYDDYDCAAIPMLVERVKIDLRRQAVHYFEYGREFAPQPLYLKSRHMDPKRPLYEAQRAFDHLLLQIPGIDWSGFGPPLEEVLPLCLPLPLPDGLTLPRWPLSPRRSTPDAS